RVSGPDRRDPDAAAPRDRERRVAPVRLHALRRLLRSLPGQDRHPARAAAPALARAQAGARAGAVARRGMGLPRRAPGRRAAAARVAPFVAAPGRKLVTDDSLSVQELDEADGALTGCTVAIAETGTIVLEGSRALTLVPDLHVCIVREPQIVQLVPEALER